MEREIDYPATGHRAGTLARTDNGVYQAWTVNQSFYHPELMEEDL